MLINYEIIENIKISFTGKLVFSVSLIRIMSRINRSKYDVWIFPDNRINSLYFLITTKKLDIKDN